MWELAELVAEILVFTILIMGREIAARIRPRRLWIERINRLVKKYHDKTGATVLLLIEDEDGNEKLEVHYEKCRTHQMDGKNTKNSSSTD